MSKFTSGKWFYDDFSAIVKTVSNNSRPICIVMEDSENDYSEEEDANGRLIAAAPEMYRTLVKVLDDTQNGQHASENELIALLNAIDGENREFNYMYPPP